MGVCEGLGARLAQIETGEIQETEIDIGFTAADWLGRFLNVIPSGTPVSPGQIGPHGWPAGTYNVSVYRYIFGAVVREVSIAVQVDRSSGLIKMIKAGLVPAFDGRVVINYAKTLE